MDKEELLAAITAGKRLVIYWKDTGARWAFYEMGSFIDEVLYRQYRQLGKRLAHGQHAINHKQASGMMEQRIRFIHQKIDALAAQTGIVFLHVEDDQEIFGYWLIVPCEHEWARNVAMRQPTNVPSIHVHRQQPNIQILPDGRVS